MLRITSLVLAPAILLTALFGTAAAGETLDKTKVCSNKPFANTINLKLTWIKIQGGNSFLFREADIYNVWENRIGFGIDTVIGSGNFFEVRPYATFTNGKVPLTLIVGYDADSTGGRYIEYGAFYPHNIGPLNVSAGLVNFSAVSPEARDYLDGSLSVTTFFNTTDSAGIDLEETHRWDGKADTLFAGPVLHSRIGPYILTTRFQLERRLSPLSGRDGYIAFVGLRIPFIAR
jgi:hypothetical protein